MAEGLEFDPGFAPYILAFQGTVNYLYADINRFKNFSQKKMKFRQYYKKILEVFNNNLGFYVGCLMWAAYINSQEEQEILNNHCFGGRYNKDENTVETDYMINFVKFFPKDMKYFIGETFEFDQSVKKILDMYKEFLVINRGFVEAVTSSDILLPEGLKTENADSFKEKIDNVLAEKDLSKLLEYTDLIIDKED